MGSSGQFDFSSASNGHLLLGQQAIEVQRSVQIKSNGHANSYTSSSKFTSSSALEKLSKCIRPADVILCRALHGVHRLRAPLLTVLMTCLFLIALYCSLSSSASYQPSPNYKFYYVEQSLRGAPTSNNSLEYVPPNNTSQRFPQVIIIGVRKGGTRALLEFLDLHEQIAKVDQEMHFFDRPEEYDKGLEWYRQQMPYSYPEQITVEKTPSYFITPEAPRRIHKMNPDTKLLLIVRDPVIRVLSDYTQILTSRRAQNLPIKSFEDLVIDPVTRKINLAYKAIQISIYHHHYRRWLLTFPPSQIHIVDGDRLIDNPVNELEKVESFLDIKHALSSSQFYYNKTKGFYCMRKNETTEKCLGPSKGRSHPEVDKHIIHRLRRFYASHNQVFFNLTGRKFDWPAG